MDFCSNVSVWCFECPLCLTKGKRHVVCNTNYPELAAKDLLNHIYKNHSDIEFKCPFCGKKFPSGSKLARHLRGCSKANVSRDTLEILACLMKASSGFSDTKEEYDCIRRIARSKFVFRSSRRPPDSPVKRLV